MEKMLSILGSSSVTQTDLNFCLRTAVRQGRREVVALLLDRGANPNIKHRSGGNALWEAITYGRTQIYHLLRQHGATIQPFVHGRTPLHMAAVHNHIDITKALMESGVPLDVRCKDFMDTYYTPAELARSRGNEALAEMIEDYADGLHSKSGGWEIGAEEGRLSQFRWGCDGPLGCLELNAMIAGRGFVMIVFIRPDFQRDPVGKGGANSPTRHIPMFAMDANIAAQRCFMISIYHKRHCFHSSVVQSGTFFERLGQGFDLGLKSLQTVFHFHYSL
jgi:hypothetical protein